MMGSMMMLTPEQYHTINNRLQSHKSSFQAWKCVSFGCSLLVIMLLLSKYYEVSSDLHQLMSMDRLLVAQETSNGSVSWPPVPIDMVLPADNETNFGMASLESNGSMLMSHMHMSLSRELTGNQLLRQEVGAFVATNLLKPCLNHLAKLAEFRTAKSTISLSSILVAIYIVSWILMTLAINDTRISNDISLRNILLLSVFGAIDVAASVCFVMVRIIMFSVKNSTFAIGILSSSGLKDTPVKLSADQLTAFTALRLIAMRSCAAYVDLYVSTVVALLTVLRLYAILRALTYYRKLRRLTDRTGLRLIGDQKPPIWTSGPHHLYPPTSTHLFAAHHHHHLISSTPPNHHNQVTDSDANAEAILAGQAAGERGPFRLISAGYRAQQQQQSPVPQHTQSRGALPTDVHANSTFRYQSGTVPPTHSKLMFSSPHQPQSSPPPPPPPMPTQPSVHRSPHTKVAQSSAAPQQATVTAANGKPRTNRTTSLQPSSKLPSSIHKLSQQQTATLQRLPHKRHGHRHRRSYTPTGTLHMNPNSSAPDLLLMSGLTRPSASYLAGQLSGARREPEEDAKGANSRGESDRRTHTKASRGLGSRSATQRLDEDTEGELVVAFDEQVATGEVRVAASQQDLLLASPPGVRGQDSDGVLPRRHHTTIGPNAYALLDPNHAFDKIGRRLFQVTGGSGGAVSGRKYKQLNGKYKQIWVPASEHSATLLKTVRPRTPRGAGSSQSLARTHGVAVECSSAATSATSSYSSSSSASASGSSTSSPAPDEGADGSRGGHSAPQKRRAHRFELPLTEEFVTATGDLARPVFERVDGKNGPSFLLSKCKFISDV